MEVYLAYLNSGTGRCNLAIARSVDAAKRVCEEDALCIFDVNLSWHWNGYWWEADTPVADTFVVYNVRAFDLIED